ncbi:hypothetical protein PRUPE_7G094900 [Prunus persica]|uniref:Uncharacterized protein n=1 Tax=Prunus persica TaxID=3760 RepID=A0A251N994_PRUPE|nr:hypothetical protein PRUPE_7G094900 [Prunus persica]
MIKGQDVHASDNRSKKFLSQVSCLYKSRLPSHTSESSFTVNRLKRDVIVMQPCQQNWMNTKQQINGKRIQKAPIEVPSVSSHVKKSEASQRNQSSTKKLKTRIRTTTK